MSSLQIGFAGTPAFALPCLHALAQSHHTFKAIYTQPDRPAGRGQKASLSPVKEWAMHHSIPVFQPINFKSTEDLETFQNLQLDVLIVIAYGLILPKKILNAPRLGCINVHASLLPQWRGASPIQQSVLHGDCESGITIMQMEAGMDTGPSLNQTKIELDPRETAESLHDKLSKLAVTPLLQVLDTLSVIHPIPQDSTQASYAPKIKKEDAKINWNTSTATLDQTIRGYYPWPIAFTELNEKQLRIYKAEPVSHLYSAPPGTLVALEQQTLIVSTQDGALRLLEVQSPGGKRLPIKEWLNANQNLSIGTLFQ